MALSAFFLSSCAATLMQPVAGAPAAHHAGAQPQLAQTPATLEGASSRGRTLLSMWERGRCVFENGRDISYSDDLGSRQRSLRLDSDARDARTILCSGDFTVLMLSDRAIVSLGGERILDGAQMLGQTGGRFIPANSYEISLKAIISEDNGAASSNLAGMALQVTSNAGRRWSIDLADPYAGWRIY